MTERRWDDETLSAWLDGETADGGQPPRARRSLSLPDRARLDELGAVSAAVGEPVAPPPVAAREAMLARALAAAAAPVDDLAALRARRTRRLDSWRWAAPVAALAAAVLVAVPLLARDDDRAGDRAALAPATKTTETTDAASADAAGGALADAQPEAEAFATRHGATLPEGVTDGGDLGDVADTASLLDRVRPGATGPRRSSAAPAAAATTSEAGADAGGSARSEEASPTDDTAGLPCGAEADAAREEELEPVYVARLRWQGTPAVVLAFSILDEQGGATGRLAVTVLAQDDCRLLASETTEA